MTMFYSRIICLFLMLVTVAIPLSVTAEPASFTLSPRMSAASNIWMQSPLYKALSTRQQLTIGVALPDYPPFAILDDERLQGITADYLGLLFEKPVRVISFPSRTAALEAVRRGDIDMVGGGTSIEAKTDDLQLSVPYLLDQAVLVSNKDAPFDPHQPNTRLALTPGYVPEERVTSSYPNSQLLMYASPRRALDALSLGEINAVLIDAVSAHYLISVNYLINLSIQSFAPIDSGGFGFLLKKGDHALLNYINYATPKVSDEYGDMILRSWSGGRQLRLSNDRIALSPVENRWLAAHPIIPVVLNDSLGALGSFDANGHAQGIGPDYLSLISRRSGLEFEYINAQNYAELNATLKKQTALLTPVYAPSHSTPDNVDIMLPYLRTSVIVMAPAKPEAGPNAENSVKVHQLSELDGQRVAIVEGYFIDEPIRSSHPSITLHPYPTLLQALRGVAEGKSDVFIGSDYAARFANALQLNNRLELIGILDDYSRPVSIALQSNEPELFSILDKAQLSISPEEIAEIVRHWEPSHPSTAWTFWRKYRQWLLRLAGFLAFATVISLIWGFYLVRQVKRTRHAEQRAEAANEAKSLFLATMSHEIRTPLSAVIGLLDLAQAHNKAPDSARSYLSAAQDTAQGMLMLLGDVLDLHRIESGLIDSSPKPVALKPLIENMASLMQGLAYRKQLQLHTQIDDSVDVWVTVDPLHLKQILFNLLGNAVKFTRSGTVRLQASGHSDSAHLHVVIDIIDSGPGISAEDQKHLFRPYSQIAATQSAQNVGSGLGLHITQRLVQHMGGTIHLRSHVGKGSTFTVALTLPLTTPPAVDTAPLPPAVPYPPTTKEGIHVLVAEDHALNLLVLTQKLEDLGYNVTGAEDGEQAWELWQQHPYQVLITDGQMPHLNGTDLVKRIREHESVSTRTPCWIVALTASTDAAEKQRYLDVGVNEILLKPISNEALANILGNVT
ncbi:MAG: ATP-binding protein [Paenalcaligenes sp.]